MKPDDDAHGGADCYGNADGTGGSQAQPERTRRSIARLAAIATGSYPLGIGIAYLIEYVRMVTL